MMPVALDQQPLRWGSDRLPIDLLRWTLLGINGSIDEDLDRHESTSAVRISEAAPLRIGLVSRFSTF
jgi:hypothetical protein